jgi:hypothetical protein
MRGERNGATTSPFFHEGEKEGVKLKPTSESPGDDVQIRCRRLGHEVPFSYCRSETRGLPCFKVLDCWYGLFLVEDHLRGELTAEEWAEVFEKTPRPRVLTLVDLIEKAKRTGEG